MLESIKIKRIFNYIKIYTVGINWNKTIKYYKHKFLKANYINKRKFFDLLNKDKLKQGTVYSSKAYWINNF